MPLNTRPSVTGRHRHEDRRARDRLCEGGAVVAADQVAAGKAIYISVGWYECHGYQGQGQGQRAESSAALTFGVLIAPKPIPYAAFLNQIRKPRRSMPSYTEEVLNDAAVEQIYAYLQSIPAGKTAAQIPALQSH